MSTQKEPTGLLSTRTLAMPAYTNPSGDIFGGWLLSEMDIAGAILAQKHAKGRVSTVALNGMTFYLPVCVGDVVCCYANLIKVGKTSLTIDIQAWKTPQKSTQRIKVTEGTFTYVAIDENRKPRPLPHIDTPT